MLKKIRISLESWVIMNGPLDIPLTCKIGESSFPEELKRHLGEAVHSLQGDLIEALITDPGKARYLLFGIAELIDEVLGVPHALEMLRHPERADEWAYGLASKDYALLSRIGGLGRRPLDRSINCEY